MFLLFEPEPPWLKWCMIEGDVLSEGRSCLLDSGDDRIPVGAGKAEDIRAIGYVLHHGGDEIREPVSLLSSDSLARLEGTVRYLPEHNEFTYRAAQKWCAALPGAAQVLLCETAFFVGLPEEASTYAVPFELHQEGIRRYGGNGLCHEWAWGRVKSALSPGMGKIVSVCLGDRTDVAAVQDGRPVETSIGFTPVEGIPSSNTCGDIDPTIVFQLNSAGMSFREINELLSRESGFSGLLGRQCGLLDILDNVRDEAIVAVRDVFRYSVMKYIGAFISVLGGVDAIVFLSAYPERVMAFVAEVCRQLEFLGLTARPEPEVIGGVAELTQDESGVKVYCLEYDRWRVMADMATRFLDSIGG